MAGLPRNNSRRGAPVSALLLGGLFFGAAHYWPQFTGGPLTAADQLYLGFFKFLGAVSVLSGVGGFYKAWLQREKRKQAELPSDTFGDAAFASLDNCAAAGLLDPNGLYLGLLDGQPLFYSGKAHLLTAAPARQGKGVSVVIPNLLHYQGSAVVTDPKGELAAVTAMHRAERLGQKVVILNPWGLHGLPQHRINPLQSLIAMAGNPALQRGLSDETRTKTMQILPEPEDARNIFFRNGSRGLIHAGLLDLALHAPERCTLPELWRIIASPRRFARAVARMQESDALGGILADLGDDLAAKMEDSPEQFEDFRSGALQPLAIFEPGSYLAEAVSGNDVPLADLKSGDVSIYLVFPSERIVSHGAGLGLIVNEAITAVARAPEKGEVLFLLDEFANLGKLSGLTESLTALPGLGVRVWMFVQELAELIRLYGPHTARTILSQAEVKQFFAVQDDQLAQTLSRALGQRTVKTRNYSLGRFDDDEIGESLAETGRPLMSPEDIRMMGGEEQLLLIKALKPVLAERLPFWFVQPWAGWADENPVEGPTPCALPRLLLEYSERTRS